MGFLIYRLEPIAFDAELQEKSQADLERLAQLLKEGCETAMKEYEDKLKDDPTFDGNNYCYKHFRIKIQVLLENGNNL